MSCWYHVSNHFRNVLRMDVTGKKLQPWLLFPISTRDKQYLPRSPIQTLPLCLYIYLLLVNVWNRNWLLYRSIWVYPCFYGFTLRNIYFSVLCFVTVDLTWTIKNQLIMEVWSFSQLNLQFNTTYDVIFIHNFKTFVVLSSIQCKATWTIIINLSW